MALYMAEEYHPLLAEREREEEWESDSSGRFPEAGARAHQPPRKTSNEKASQRRFGRGRAAAT